MNLSCVGGPTEIDRENLLLRPSEQRFLARVYDVRMLHVHCVVGKDADLGLTFRFVTDCACVYSCCFLSMIAVRRTMTWRKWSAKARNSSWAKSEKVTVWSHEREQRFDTSNLFFNLWKTVMAWSYWAEACKTWRKWANRVLPMVAMATGHRFSRNPPFNASKGCVKWSKGINYSWETLDFAGLQKNREIRCQKTRFFSFLASRCNHVLKLATLFEKKTAWSFSCSI